MLNPLTPTGKIREWRSREAVVTELVAAVKLHAHEHYDEGGWDVVVETYDDAQIAQVIGLARTEAGAIAKFADLVSVWADRQADARNSAF